jgi:hypothetical protein
MATVAARKAAVKAARMIQSAATERENVFP